MLKKTRKFIGKSLQPARPVHHLPSKQAAIALDFPTELPSSTEVCLPGKVDLLSEATEAKSLSEAMMACQPKQHQSEEKKERIKYSRDFLLKLSSASLSQKKPEFLSDHPIILEKPEKRNPFTDMCKK
ncbi:uncharacterized protein C8orf88 homolog [Dryobates pubescens]|uniref:uncharacterized protein C8orf88 homolog n=1 Tax=Dryobates pubescens TaxID=118200 RepID=UPI0023B8DE39|nr:uncharacterized protein C8orf88 homolog [Dryobates pubescens]